MKTFALICISALSILVSIVIIIHLVEYIKDKIWWKRNFDD